MRRVVALLLLLPPALVWAAAGSPEMPNDGQGSSPPLCERQDCNCTEGVVPGRGLRASCDFTLHQVVQINASSLPPRLHHLTISGGAEVRLLPLSFSRLALLERASFARIRRLQVRHHAFDNASGFNGAGLLLEIEDCEAVVLESDAFHALRAPLTALVARTGHVVVQGSAFSWLRAISLVDVPRLDLHEYAFALDKGAHLRGAPLAKVVLQNVVLADIPRHAFPSPLADVLIAGSEVRAIRRDAFSALQMRAIALLETSVHRIDGGAFSARTLLTSLELRGARLHQVSSGAVCAAVTNLTISHSKMWEVLSGGFNLTVATVSLTHSVLERVRSRGFVLNKWSSMELRNNTFALLEPYAFTAPFQPFPGVDLFHFRFTRNQVGDALPGAFGFAAIANDEDDDIDDLEAVPDQPFLPAEVSGNLFERPCHCQMSRFLEDLVTIHPGIPTDHEPWITGNLFFNTSSCYVDAVLARCFRLSEGYLGMLNFTEEVCATSRACEDDAQNDVVDPRVVRPSIFQATDTEPIFEPEMDQKKVLVSIFIVVVAGVSLVLAVSAAAWVARKGQCGRMVSGAVAPSRGLCTALCSRMRAMTSRSDASATGGLVSASSARSISRLSVHDYVRQHGTGTGVTTLTLHEPSEDLDDGDAWIPCEDKATQTLPEELTQELLQSLREKLDDPENYSEARDMIEHLYDLIKVEESCNNNDRSLSELRLDDLDTDNELEDDATAGENVYDVIRPKPRPRGLQMNSKLGRSTASVGTRAPSPDKLAPLCEYGEPKDRQPHLYTELPGAGAGLGTGRPAGMLRTIGQSIANLPAAAISGSRPTLLCDYAEPTDAKVHVYCELPGGSSASEAPTAPCSPATPSRMANRPLPSKPDDPLNRLS